MPPPQCCRVCSVQVCRPAPEVTIEIIRHKCVRPIVFCPRPPVTVLRSNVNCVKPPIEVKKDTVREEFQAPDVVKQLISEVKYLPDVTRSIVNDNQSVGSEIRD